MSHTAIPSEDVYFIVIHPHREWDVPHRKCTSSRGMGMCLTGNDVVPHRECTSSPGMCIFTGNAHCLYRVYTLLNSDNFTHKNFGLLNLNSSMEMEAQEQKRSSVTVIPLLDLSLVMSKYSTNKL